MTTLPTAEEWLAYLKAPGRKKMTGQFEDENDHEARCCLGHYAHLAGLEYISDQCSFVRADEEDVHIYEEAGQAVLPPDHFLFGDSPDGTESWLHSPVSIQGKLTNINDDPSASDDFRDVIAYIEAYLIA